MEDLTGDPFTAIERLVMANAVTADERRYEEYVQLYAPDGVLAIENGPAMTGRDEILAGLKAGAERRGAAVPGHFQRHNVTTRHIELIDEDNAKGTVYVIVNTELGLDHIGHYTDRYVRIDGRWLFQTRMARAEWMNPNSRFLKWIAPAEG